MIGSHLPRPQSYIIYHLFFVGGIYQVLNNIKYQDNLIWVRVLNIDSD